MIPFKVVTIFFFIGKRSHKLPHQQTVMEYPECAVTAELYAVFSILAFSRSHRLQYLIEPQFNTKCLCTIEATKCVV